MFLLPILRGCSTQKITPQYSKYHIVQLYNPCKIVCSFITYYKDRIIFHAGWHFLFSLRWSAAECVCVCLAFMLQVQLFRNFCQKHSFAPTFVNGGGGYILPFLLHPWVCIIYRDCLVHDYSKSCIINS